MCVRENKTKVGWCGRGCPRRAAPNIHNFFTSAWDCPSLLLLHATRLCRAGKRNIAQNNGWLKLRSHSVTKHTPAQLVGTPPSTEFCTQASPACHSSHARQPWPCPAEERISAHGSGEHCCSRAVSKVLGQQNQRLNFCGTIAPAHFGELHVPSHFQGFQLCTTLCLSALLPVTLHLPCH